MEENIVTQEASGKEEVAANNEESVRDEKQVTNNVLKIERQGNSEDEIGERMRQLKEDIKQMNEESEEERRQITKRVRQLEEDVRRMIEESKERRKKMEEETRQSKERTKHLNRIADIYLWEGTWTKLGFLIVSDKNRLFDEYPMVKKQYSKRKFEEILSRIQTTLNWTVTPLSEDGMEQFQEEAPKIRPFTNRDPESARYEHLKRLLNLLMGDESNICIQSFCQQAFLYPPDSHCYDDSIKPEEWKKMPLDEKSHKSFAVIEVEKFISNKLTREEGKGENKMDQVLPKLISRCFQSDCPGPEEGKGHFPWVGLIFDHFRVAAVVIYHTDQGPPGTPPKEEPPPGSRESFLKPPIYIARTKPYYMAGNSKRMMEGADLIRKVIAFGRRASLFRESQKRARIQSLSE